MGDKITKPLLTSEELINHMENRGIKFNCISKEDALSFLKANNNYFKLSSYRKNFAKYTEGDKKGLYIDLDFAYLIDLSTIDMHLRHLLLKMTLDIEHYVKVNLLQHIEGNPKEDGYQIVNDFISNLTGEEGTNIIIKDIRRNVGNPYCGELISKYNITYKSDKIENFPVWAFVEVISFGALRTFIDFYYNKYQVKDKLDIRYLLLTVNQLRNAVAHNNCIINNLYPVHPDSVKSSKANYSVMQFISKAKIAMVMRDTKMKNPRIKQIVTMLHVFDNTVTSSAIKRIRYEELSNFITNRMKYKKSYYIKNPTITTAYMFIQKLSLFLYENC